MCGFNRDLVQHMSRLYYRPELGTGTSVKCGSSLQDPFSLARRERHSLEMYYDNEQEEKYLPDGSTIYGINWFTVMGE